MKPNLDASGSVPISLTNGGRQIASRKVFTLVLAGSNPVHRTMTPWMIFSENSVAAKGQYGAAAVTYIGSGIFQWAVYHSDGKVVITGYEIFLLEAMHKADQHLALLDMTRDAEEAGMYDE